MYFLEKRVIFQAASHSKTNITPKNGGFQVRNLQTSRGPLFSGAFAGC